MGNDFPLGIGYGGGVERLPYGLRYLVALIAWSGVVVGDIFLRIVFVPILPYVWLRMGARLTQAGTQFEITAVEFYTRPLMRPPKPDWLRLLGRSSRAAKCSPARADEPTETRLLKKVGDSRT